MRRDGRCARDLGPGDEVPAVSLWQPWASLMALGRKRIETRHWPIRYRGPLLIHAAKRRAMRELRDCLDEPEFQRCLKPLASGRFVRVEDLPFGCGVALVDVYESQRTELLGHRVCDDEYRFGDFSHGRYGWLTWNLRRLKPFPLTGRQGLFTVRLPDDLADWEG